MALPVSASSTSIPNNISSKSTSSLSDKLFTSFDKKDSNETFPSNLWRMRAFVYIYANLSAFAECSLLRVFVWMRFWMENARSLATELTGVENIRHAIRLRRTVSPMASSQNKLGLVDSSQKRRPASKGGCWALKVMNSRIRILASASEEV